jgi:hypothetical protein
MNIGVMHDSYVRRFTIISYDSLDDYEKHAVEVMFKEGYFIESVWHQKYQGKIKQFAKYYKKLSEDDVSV